MSDPRIKERIVIPVEYEIWYEPGMREQIIKKIKPWQEELGKSNHGLFRILCLGVKDEPTAQNETQEALLSDVQAT